MHSASALLAELDQAPSIAAYSVAARKLKELAGTLPAFRLAILANHTFDIETTLWVECFRRGLATSFYQAGYDQYRQELLSSDSALDRFQPDAVLISLHLENTFPGISAATSATVQPLPAIEEWTAQFRALLEAYRQRSAAPVFILDFIPPAAAMDGVASASAGTTLAGWVMELSRELRRAAATLPSVFLIGAAELAARSDLPAWRDPRMWYLARVGINPKKFPVLAPHIARHLAALRRPAAKCLVLDLDNTLWGGILGELGPDGIHCAGGDYPANAYADFQCAVLALRARGILLAVASKNDAPLVEEVFRKRSDMPLRPEHIADWEIHWGPKPESLQRIAARLNIGLDSLVFLDDNPDEVQLVRMALPQVRAYLMPSAPERFVAFLAGLEDFDQLQLSAEDLRRAELYAIRKQQTEAAAAATDLESFYRSLETVLAPEPAGPANFERIVQLIQKTNQFNLTTRRHDKPALLARLEQGSELWAFRASDVNGDHGIIALGLLDFEGPAATLDTLLMSCRVIGRTLETAILHFLEERAAARGATTFRGEYLPTPKNGPCADFYPRHGFERGAGAEWTRSLTDRRTSCPEWITIQGEVSEACAKT